MSPFQLSNPLAGEISTCAISLWRPQNRKMVHEKRGYSTKARKSLMTTFSFYMGDIPCYLSGIQDGSIAIGEKQSKGGELWRAEVKSLAC